MAPARPGALKRLLGGDRGEPGEGPESHGGELSVSVRRGLSLKVPARTARARVLSPAAEAGHLKGRGG